MWSHKVAVEISFEIKKKRRTSVLFFSYVQTRQGKNDAHAYRRIKLPEAVLVLR